MNERLFYVIILILVILSIGGVFTLFKNQNQVAKNNNKEEVLSLVGQNEITNSTTKKEDMSKNKELKQPELIIDANKTYEAKLSTTKGDIVISLDTTKTPVTSNNFVYLAKQGFYDNTIFHRVIDGFMIQGGDPKGNGTGGPGYRFDDEPFEGDYVRGTVAMANAGPNTNGSQFFIMHKDNPLPKNYVIFGQVKSGIETVDAIAGSQVEMSVSGELSSPVDPIIVEKVEIVEK